MQLNIFMSQDEKAANIFNFFIIFLSSLYGYSNSMFNFSFGFCENEDDDIIKTYKSGDNEENLFNLIKLDNRYINL